MKKSKKAGKYAAKKVTIRLPGRPGVKTLAAAEALAFSQQLAQKNQWSALIVVVKQLTEQVPGYDQPWLLLFQGHHQAGDYSGLMEAADHCLKHNPRFVPAMVSKATALRINQFHTEALALIEKALRLEPGNARLLNHLGIVQKELGQHESALASFNRCIKLDPNHCEPYWNRSDLLNEPQSDDIDAMESRLQKPGLSSLDQARLHYSLARAKEFLGDTEAQFEHIEAGAKLKRESLNYDHDVELARINQIPEVFTPDMLQQPSGYRETGSVPIFICGLPRSGTTLVEQILSSHPQVQAGDELYDLPLAASHVLQRKGGKVEFPQWGGELSEEEWKSLGERYYGTTRALQGQRFFTDKNLQNYQAIGVIKKALPEAKIIICQRHPMDNLWSCYRQLFADGLMFTYSQTELADIWNAASRLQNYWQAQLGEHLFVLEHEQLLENQEQTTRALLEYVGLEWDISCMEFQSNPRPVRTTSALQVRKPLNSARQGQWKIFERQLQPMKERLNL